MIDLDAKIPLASRARPRVGSRAGGQLTEVARVKITEAGRRALAEHGGWRAGMTVVPFTRQAYCELVHALLWWGRDHASCRSMQPGGALRYS